MLALSTLNPLNILVCHPKFWSSLVKMFTFKVIKCLFHNYLRIMNFFLTSNEFWLPTSFLIHVKCCQEVRQQLSGAGSFLYYVGSGDGTHIIGLL